MVVIRAITGKLRLSAGRKGRISTHSYKGGSTVGPTGVVPPHQMPVNICVNEWYTWKYEQGCHLSHYGQITALGRRKTIHSGAIRTSVAPQP